MEYPGLTAVGFLPWFKRQNFPESAEIVAKIDVEGAECTVLDTWMDAGMTCRVSQYFVEWHARFDTTSTSAKPPCQLATKARLIREVGNCNKRGFNITYKKWT
uniref:Methyltransferase FkbM domain-containing protein n=1 Tax=Hemiselmis andersenii TaxID=464988 RepID=A0A7S0XWU0_HEMAN|mmetsp:Transcript_30536/g.71250  ORF Transcript_30536/g.71250 Transcript_30536/m.71250 type:complete len:103 (+) Transcript_30536:1-309(+)